MAEPKPTHFFETKSTTVATLAGGNHPGTAFLHFHTPSGPDFVTHLLPRQIASLYRMLKTPLSNSGEPEAGYRDVMDANVPGSEGTTTGKISEYFGQKYDSKVLECLGLLVVRVNLLDRKLISLIRALSGMNESQTSAQYYSSTSMRAKLDGILSINKTSGLSDEAKARVENAITLTRKVSGRRNDIFHANWVFRRNKLRAQVIKPNTANTKTEIAVTPKTLILLAEDYQSAGLSLTSAVLFINKERRS